MFSIINCMDYHESLSEHAYTYKMLIKGFYQDKILILDVYKCWLIQIWTLFIIHYNQKYVTEWSFPM